MASFSSSHLIFIFSLLLTYTCSNAEDPWWSFCNDNNKINSTKISSNIDRILPKLVSQTSTQGGYTFLASGSGNDRVYGLAQCRGDVLNTKECSTCIKEASVQIQKLCPKQADARILYEYCFLRYDTRKFVGELDNSNGVIYSNVENTNDFAEFDKVLGELKDKVVGEALDRKNRIGFGKGETKLAQFTTLYALVQCTRDISKLACAQCLATAVGNFDGFCKDKIGCRSIYSSCFVRYELYPIVYPGKSNRTAAGNVYSRHLLHP